MQTNEIRMTPNSDAQACSRAEHMPAAPDSGSGSHRDLRAGWRRACLRCLTAMALLLGALAAGGCGAGEEAMQDEVLESRQVTCCPGGTGLLGADVNSRANDYAPFIERGTAGETLWFTSSRAVGGKKPTDLPADVFRSTRPTPGVGVCASRGWSRAARMDLVQADFDGMTKGAVTQRGDVRILAVEQGIDRSAVLAPAASSYNLFLWSMVRGADGRWSEPLPLDAVNLASAWTSQPTLSPSGDTLVFVSNRTNPLAPSDTSINIWASVRENGVWTAPRMLARIASPGHDMSPMIDARGELYFASNWDFAAKGPSRAGYDIWHAGALDVLLGGAEATVLNMNTFTTVSGCMGDAAFTVNTSANEIFPFIDETQYGRSLYYASDRSGGYGGYDIYGCALPSPCVKIRPEVFCFEGGDVPVENFTVEGRPLASQPLQVTINGATRSAMSGEEISVRVGDEVTVTRGSLTEHCLTVTCWPTTLRVPFSNEVIPVQVRCDCNRTPDETVVISDASGVPYFITGYWWPNTKRNFTEFQSKYAGGRLRASRFIDRNDYDYACASSHIDGFFEREVYQKMDRALEKMRPCSGELTLLVTVIGYTDACGLSQGDYAADGEVRMRDVTIAEGTNMWARSLPAATGQESVVLRDGGQRGNVILSKLRAYFTMKTIDREMSSRSATYRDLFAQKRIVYDFDGFGIYDKNAWRSNPPTSGETLSTGCRKTGRAAGLGCNDPEGRRIEIYMTLVPSEDQRALATRPMATDMLEPEDAPPPAAKVRACECFRIEHAFRSADDARFVREILQRLAATEMERDSITIEQRSVNGSVVHVLRSGCLGEERTAQEASRTLRTATTSAADVLRAFAPSVSMQCRLFGISMGTLQYLKNAVQLRDTLRAMLGGTWAIEHLPAKDGETVYRVREGWYASERAAQDAIDGYAGKLRQAGLRIPMRVVRELQQ